jgi:DNA polymerase-3 subunit alpha
MFALLKNEKSPDNRTEYLIEAKRMNIPVKLPHINDSGKDFQIEGKGIRFGLTAIKFISDKIADKYISAKPFKNYKEVEEFTFTKGNGVNSRALAAMNAVGALTFEDNPRDDQNIKENLYEYLNLPEFNIVVPSHYHAFVQDVCNFEEKGSFILMGIVKSIKRGKGWSRVEILDKTGSVGIFDDEDPEIEIGKTYLVLVNDNRIINHVMADHIKGSSNSLVKFLNYKQLPFTEEEMFVLGFKSRTTKTGKKMASITVANNLRELQSVLVFPTSFAKAYMHIKEGNAYKFVLGETKDGTVILEDVLI